MVITAHYFLVVNYCVFQDILLPSFSWAARSLTWKYVTFASGLKPNMNYYLVRAVKLGLNFISLKVNLLNLYRSFDASKCTTDCLTEITRWDGKRADKLISI